MFEIYKNKKVFITGHTGFKGSWLTLWLKFLGADVLGYSLEPNTTPSMFEELRIYGQCKNEFANILDSKNLEEIMNKFQPEIVFHLAAQAVVRKSYKDPVLTYKTNVLGTLNVLEAARKCKSVKAFVNVTTDKCYENKDISKSHKETDTMGGYDMYSSSKSCVEIMSNSYRESFLENEGYALACARAGNAIGGGDWAEDRLIPDCIRAINSDTNIEIRNPNAIRPFQHVLEALGGYLTLGEKLLIDGKKFAEGFNFGTEENNILKVYDIAKLVVENYGKGELVINKKDNLHEAEILMLNIDKSKKMLEWYPKLTIEEAIKMTVDWYKRFYNEEDMTNFTLNQIKEYSELQSNKALETT